LQGFQDLEKVLNLAKMYVKYLKSMEILIGKEIKLSERDHLLFYCLV